MATFTNKGLLQACLFYVNQANSTYLALGRQEPWTNEDMPPIEDPNVTVLDSVIGYKKVNRVSLCRPIDKGVTPKYPVINHGKQSYELIPTDKAEQETGRFMVFYEGDVQGSELPLGEYRQVGIHTGLLPKSGVAKKALLPSEVQSTGVLQFYLNTEQYNRTADSTVIEQFVIAVDRDETVEREVNS